MLPAVPENNYRKHSVQRIELFHLIQVVTGKKALAQRRHSQINEGVLELRSAKSASGLVLWSHQLSWSNLSKALPRRYYADVAVSISSGFANGGCVSYNSKYFSGR